MGFYSNPPFKKVVPNFRETFNFNKTIYMNFFTPFYYIFKIYNKIKLQKVFEKILRKMMYNPVKSYT